MILKKKILQFRIIIQSTLTKSVDRFDTRKEIPVNEIAACIADDTKLLCILGNNLIKLNLFRRYGRRFIVAVSQSLRNELLLPSKLPNDVEIDILYKIFIIRYRW